MCPVRTLKDSQTPFGVDCVSSTAASNYELGLSHKTSVKPHVSDSNSSKSESCFTFECEPEPTPHPEAVVYAVLFEPKISTIITGQYRQEHCHSGSHMEASQRWSR